MDFVVFAQIKTSITRVVPTSHPGSSVSEDQDPGYEVGVVHGEKYMQITYNHVNIIFLNAF